MTADKKPSRSGLSQEEAFKRWGDPATYEIWDAHQGAWQHISMADGVPPNQAVLRHQAYARALEALREQLRAVLIEGEVLASGIRNGSDGRNVIKPSLWEDMEFSDDFDEFYANGMIFTKPQYFTATDIPANIEERPIWLTKHLTESRTSLYFQHDHDYSHVSVGDVSFVFGPLQAAAIRKLHAAYKTGESWVFGKTILRDINSNSTNIRELFRSNLNWESLVQSDRRGKYRLKLPDV